MSKSSSFNQSSCLFYLFVFLDEAALSLEVFIAPHFTTLVLQSKHCFSSYSYSNEANNEAHNQNLLQAHVAVITHITEEDRAAESRLGKCSMTQHSPVMQLLFYNRGEKDFIDRPVFSPKRQMGARCCSLTQESGTGLLLHAHHMQVS